MKHQIAREKEEPIGTTQTYLEKASKRVPISDEARDILIDEIKNKLKTEAENAELQQARDRERFERKQLLEASMKKEKERQIEEYVKWKSIILWDLAKKSRIATTRGGWREGNRTNREL